MSDMDMQGIYANVENGSIVTIKPFNPARRRGWKPDANKDFVMVWPAEIDAIQLTGASYRALFKLAQIADKDTGVLVYRLKDLIEVFDVATPIAVQRIIGKVVAAGAARYLRKGAIMLNPWLVWRGSKEARDNARLVWEER